MFITGDKPVPTGRTAENENVRESLQKSATVTGHNEENVGIQEQERRQC